MAQKIRWGLLGAGKIVNRWMRGALQPQDMEITAVASRTCETAETVAKTWNIPRVMTYDEMLEADDIDVVYIPVPHTAHKELALRALRAKKAVLVEKPAAVNAGEWAEMVTCARENHTFLMEAYWTRFFPAMAFVRKTIAEGAIGEVRVIQANFSSHGTRNPASRLWNPETAGGGLLDIGVYNLQFARLIYDRAPVSLIGSANIAGGVDEQEAYIAHYDRGELAIMASGLNVAMDDTARIYGTEGQIILPVHWKNTSVTVARGRERKTYDFPVPQNVAGIADEGFQYEVAHVNECLRQGLIESPEQTHAITAEILEQCDTLRRQWGLVYPCEK